MKATKFLLLVWAMALVSIVGWSQTINQPTLKLSNPVESASSNIAVCPGGGSVLLSYISSGGTVQLELRANTSLGPLVPGFGVAGIIAPAPMGTVVDTPVTLPALTAGTTYFLIVNVTSATTSVTSSVTIIPTALPASPAFTMTPSTVCVQPGNASVATVTSPNTANFGYTWSKVEGVPAANSLLSATTGTTTTITPQNVGTTAITLTAAYRSMSCGTTSSTQTLTGVSADVPKINNTPGAAAGITVDSPAIFTGAAPYATFPTVPVADFAVCEGSTITLSSYCPPGQIASWYRGGVEIGTDSPINIVPVNPGGPAYNEYTYSVKCRVIGSANCESESRSITVKTIKQTSLVAVPTLATESTCQLPSDWIVSPTTINVTKTANCPAGSVAQWYDNAADVLGTPAATGPTRTLSINLLNAGTTTWYVTCKQGLCESAAKASATFTVIAKPGTPTITNTNGDVVCANAPATPSQSALILTALCAPGTTANWYLASVTGTTGLTVVPPTGDPNVGILGTGGSYTHASGPGTATYQVRCKDNTSGCWSELSASRTITINPVATPPTGTLVWTGGTSQICMSLTPGATANPDLTSLTCAVGNVKWYNAAGTATIAAPTALSIVGAANPGPNPDGTLVTTYTYQVACEDATADPALMNTCESSKITVAITVVRAPAAPTMTLDLNKTVAGTDGSVANNMNICQGPNDETVINGNCPTSTGWTTQWQIVGSIATKGTGADWSVDAPQTENGGTTLIVNAFNFNPANTSAAFGWTIKVRCNNANIPAGCTTGATTEYTNVVVRQKENPQTFQMEVPAGTVIPSGQDLCLGTTIKFVQTTAPGNLCTGTLQWRSRFRATVGSGAFGAWDIVIDETTSTIPYTLTPSATGEYEYQIRCNGLCPGDWSASQSVAISKAASAAFTLSPTNVACQEPSAGTLITLALSGCANSAGVTGSEYRIDRTVKNGAAAAVTTTDYAIVGSIGANQNWTETVNASATNSTDIVYTYVVSCRQTFDLIAGGASTCTGDKAAAQTITIRTKPAAPTNLAVNATPICVGGTAILTATCAEGDVEWDQITNVITAGTPKMFTGSPFTITNVPSSVSYRARCVVGSCNGNYAVQQVSVSVIDPVKPVLSQTTPVICPSPSIVPSVKTTTLTATGCSGAQESLVWSSPGVTFGATATGNAAANYALTVTTGAGSAGVANIVTGGGNYIFTATCTRPGGCVSTEVITVTVLPDPQISITPTPQTVCAGAPLTLTAASVLGPIGGHSWTGSGSLVTPLNQNDPSISAPIAGGATVGMSGTYNLTANYQGCVFSTLTAPVKTATVTVNAKPAAPVITAPAFVCEAGAPVMLTATTACAGGSSIVWMPSGPSVSTAGTYTAKCVLTGCESVASNSVVITAKPFEVTIIDVGQSANKTNGSMLTNWNRIYPEAAAVPAVLPVPTGTQTGPVLDATTAAMRRTFDNYQTPRFWTVNVAVCSPTVAAATKSVSYEMYLLNPTTDAIIQSFNTVENNAPYLQFGNGLGGFTKLYTLNDPEFGFYSPTGVYDAGFPKGKYNWRIRAYDKPGIDYGPYPSNVTKNPDPTAAILAEGNYYIQITNASGARASAEVVEESFATVTPNPVTRTLTLSINGAKGQDVKLNLVDAAGRSLMTRSITPASNTHREEVDMSNNNTGMYFMQVTSPTKRAALKVLKVSQD